MAGRFVYWMNVSLDLFIEREAGEHGDIEGPSWIRLSEPLHREFSARARAMPAMVEGRIVYEMMDPFWPNARTNESLPGFLREFGEIWTDIPKVLVSRTRTTAKHNTRIIGGDNDAIEQLAVLRRETDGDIGIGGATLATQLLQAHLLDELLLFTHPVVLGGGRPLFDALDQPLELDLLEQRSFDQGVTMHRYAVRGASAGVRPDSFQPQGLRADSDGWVPSQTSLALAHSTKPGRWQRCGRGIRSSPLRRPRRAGRAGGR